MEAEDIFDLITSKTLREGLETAYDVLSGDLDECDTEALTKIQMARLHNELSNDEVSQEIGETLDRAAKKMKDYCKIELP